MNEYEGEYQIARENEDKVEGETCECRIPL